MYHKQPFITKRTLSIVLILAMLSASALNPFSSYARSGKIHSHTPSNGSCSDGFTETTTTSNASSEPSSAPSSHITQPASTPSDASNYLQTYSVSTETEFRDAISLINQSEEGHYLISLDDDISLTGTDGIKLTANETTLSGNGHTLFWDGVDTHEKHSMLSISGSDTILNLGAADSDDTLTLDGNDKNSASSLIAVTEGSLLNMYENTTIQNVFRQSAGAAVSLKNAALRIYGGMITNCRNTDDPTTTKLLYRGAAIYADSSTIDMYDGMICNNQSDANGTISLNDCTFHMYGGTISNNVSGYHGGGIHALDSEVHLHGGTLSFNKCRQEGGAVRAASASKLYLYSGILFDQNTSESKGAAVALYGKNTTLTMNGGLFQNNNAPHGGAIFLSISVQATINGGRFIQNSSLDGSAIYLSGSSHADLYDVDITQNHSITGGTIFVWNSSVNLYGGNVSENDSTSGGAFRQWLTSTVNIYGGKITNNTASQGGAFSLYGNTDNKSCVLNIHDGTITGNRADFGGAILSDSATVTISGGTITNNHATKTLGGGIYAISATILTVREYVHLHNNSAAAGGDDIYFSNSASNSSWATSSLSLNDTFHGSVLIECGDPIFGWYVDGMIDKKKIPRWNTHHADQDFQFITLAESNFKEEVALKAAHGLIGNVSVSKVVTGNDGEQERDFQFQMTLSNQKINGTYGDLDFENGTASFTLKDGETKIARSLPATITYSVTENAESAFGYTTTMTGNSGIVIADETANAVFINHKETQTPPDTPATPSNPDTPNPTATPSNPDTPNPPATPSNPDTPNPLATPSNPDTPNPPNTPSTPDTPNPTDFSPVPDPVVVPSVPRQSDKPQPLDSVPQTADPMDLISWTTALILSLFGMIASCKSQKWNTL